MHKIIFILALFIFGQSVLYAQEKEIRQIQPTIMVIPYAKQDEDIRTVMEEDIIRRVAISKVQEGFDNRGFTTIDFVAKLKAATLDDTYSSSDLSDLKSTIVSGSGADIYVEVEAYRDSSATGNSARIILKAYDAFTGRSLGNKTESSPKFYTDDFGRLAEKALSKKDRDTQIEMIEDFLNMMQEKFTDIVENGRPIKVLFTLDPNVDYDFDFDLTTGELLSDEIDIWLEENAYKSNYHQQGATDLRLTYDEVRIPLKDDRGRNYTPRKFASKVRKFCLTLKLLDGDINGIDRDVRGGVIYITFQ